MKTLYEIVGFVYFWGMAGIIGLYFLSFILQLGGKFRNLLTEDKKQ